MIESGNTSAAAGASGGHPGAAEGNAVDTSVKITIASEHDAIRDVQDRIIAEVERLAFDTQSHFAIKLALEEALINAIKHGNRMDPRKKVHIEYRIDASQLEVTIEDEGPGFDRRSVPDPTLDENLEKCSGRGILLIEAYMNSVRWTRGGRRLHMLKKNQSELKI